MGWPCRVELWGPTLAEARADYAVVANSIAAFEPVTMIANPGSDAQAALGQPAAPAVEVVELPLDDSWLRDCGPIYTYGEEGRARRSISASTPGGRSSLAGIATPPSARLIAERLGDPVVRSSLVLEGGSILLDGRGTLLTTEQCLLHPSRNPSLSRDEIEAELSAATRRRALRVVGPGTG